MKEVISAGMRLRNIIPLSFVVVLSVLISFSCSTRYPAETGQGKIQYPRPLPDSLPLTFLPGIVSRDSFDFNAAFSPDGLSFYFTRRSGKQSKIYVTHVANGIWTAPVATAFTASGHSEADPAFGPDGKFYFISNRPKDPSDTLLDYDIWYVSPLAGGRWSEPENFKAINSDSAEFYISFSGNGNLYFASSRKGGFGQEDIYVSQLTDNGYSTAENLGAAINTERSEYDPCISAKEDVIIFTSSNRGDTFGAGDLYASTTGAGNQWLTAKNLGKKFNTETREFCAYFSPDSNYFFYSTNGDVKWISHEALRNHLRKLW